MQNPGYPAQPPSWSPPLPGQEPPAPQDRPLVVTLFYVYCALSAVVYVVVAIGGVALAVIAPGTAQEAEEIRIQGIAMAIVGPPLAVFFGVAPLLPRRPWAWIYGIVAIALTLTSCCCWPMSMPLLIFWAQQDARRWYGMGS